MMMRSVMALTAAGDAVVDDDVAVDRCAHQACTVRQVQRTTTEASRAVPLRSCPDLALTAL